MSNTPQNWSSDPYAPQISPHIYSNEKINFVGFLMGSVFYGIIVVLFFQCMGALLNPVDRIRGIKWGFVVHTAVMFSVATVYNADNLALQSLSYINNREYPGDNDGYPGPFNYQYIIYNKPIAVVPAIMFILNYWLADGLLLYRCCLLYAMNYWVIAFPCLMYLASLATGISFIYQGSRPVSVVTQYVAIADFGKAYYSISLSLDVLLTLMIVARVALHSMEFRNAMGSLVRSNKVYKALATILVESCALYTVSYLLFLGPWASSSPVCDAFFPMLAANQVIAPFLVILRVANRSAMTSDAITSGSTGSSSFTSRGRSTNGSRTLIDKYPMSPMEMDGESSCKVGVEVAVTTDEFSM